ncbi:MAG: hypothetical protein QW478_08075 [Candidatus Micrarchaeaceae archaeon]
MADGVSQVKISRVLIKAFFPALLFGVVGLLVFGLFGALFGMMDASISSGASSSVTGPIPLFFASFPTMGFLGFVLGFGGYLGYKFEEEI